MASFADKLPGFIGDPIKSVLKTPWRRQLSQLVNLGLIVSSALMSWKTLILATGSESPVVVVLSGSMEPAFQRGDILFLNMGTSPLRVGEIPVFSLLDKDVPIVHRALEVHERAASNSGGIPGARAGGLVVSGGLQGLLQGQPPSWTADVLTKGDNNSQNDRMLYNRGQRWIGREHVMGRAVGFVPYVGMVTIIMNDYPALKVVVIGALALLCLVGLDE